MTHKKEQQIKIEGEFKPTVDCLCATRRGFVVYKLSQGAHEESERVQTSGLSNPVERTVLNCDKVLASMNREVQTQRTEQFLEPYYEVCEQIELADRTL